MLGLFYFYINYLKKNNSSLCFSVFRRGSVEKHIFSTPQQIGLILISGCACILYACNFQPLIKDSQYIANCWSCWILLLSKYYHSQFNFSKIKGMKLLQIGKQDLTSNWSDSILQCLWTGQWLKYSHTLTLIPLIYYKQQRTVLEWMGHWVIPLIKLNGQPTSAEYELHCTSYNYR